jgi:hypothetical protein
MLTVYNFIINTCKYHTTVKANVWCAVVFNDNLANVLLMMCGYLLCVYVFSLRHCAASRKVAGSIPDGVTGIFQ